MLVSEVVSRVRDSIGDRGGIFATENLVMFWCSEAISDIYRQTDIGKNLTLNETLAAGTNTISLTADGFRVSRAYNSTNKLELKETTKENLVDAFGPTFLENQGEPTYYVMIIAGGVTDIELYPIPDFSTDITVEYTGHPEMISSTATDLSLIIPAVYHMDIIRFCIMRAHEKEKDFQAAEKAQEHYQSNINARRDEAHRLDDSFFTISADPYDFI